MARGAEKIIIDVDGADVVISPCGPHHGSVVKRQRYWWSSSIALRMKGEAHAYFEQGDVRGFVTNCRIKTGRTGREFPIDATEAWNSHSSLRMLIAEELLGSGECGEEEAASE